MCGGYPCSPNFIERRIDLLEKRLSFRRLCSPPYGLAFPKIHNKLHSWVPNQQVRRLGRADTGKYAQFRSRGRGQGTQRTAMVQHLPGEVEGAGAGERVAGTQDQGAQFSIDERGRASLQ